MIARREEIPGYPVTVSVQTAEYRFPITNTVWDGLHRVFHNGKEYLADRSIVHDAGKMGTGLSFIEHGEGSLDLDGIDRAVRKVCPGWKLNRDNWYPVKPE